MCTVYARNSIEAGKEWADVFAESGDNTPPKKLRERHPALSFSKGGHTIDHARTHAFCAQPGCWTSPTDGLTTSNQLVAAMAAAASNNDDVPGGGVW